MPDRRPRVCEAPYHEELQRLGDGYPCAPDESVAISGLTSNAPRESATTVSGTASWSAAKRISPLASQRGSRTPTSNQDRHAVAEGNTVAREALDLGVVLGDEVAADGDVALVAHGDVLANQGGAARPLEADAARSATQRLANAGEEYGESCWTK